MCTAFYKCIWVVTIQPVLIRVNTVVTMFSRVQLEPGCFTGMPQLGPSHHNCAEFCSFKDTISAMYPAR